jgi:serine/threonine protein kinase
MGSFEHALHTTSENTDPPASPANLRNPSSSAIHTYSTHAEDYELRNTIGCGSSAVVYLANYKLLKEQLCIKQIDLDRFERNQIDELRREIQVMSLCRHTNVLPIKASFVHDAKLWIVMPFLAAGKSHFVFLCRESRRGGYLLSFRFMFRHYEERTS